MFVQALSSEEQKKCRRNMVLCKVLSEKQAQI